MAPISLGDTLDLDLIPAGTVGDGGIKFTCSDPALSDAKDNLATKAARLFIEEFKLTTGVRIHLDKAVPVGAGLGGGSSDAAAVLLVLRELTKVGCPDAKLANWPRGSAATFPFSFTAQRRSVAGEGKSSSRCGSRKLSRACSFIPALASRRRGPTRLCAKSRPGRVGRVFDGFTLRKRSRTGRLLEISVAARGQGLVPETTGSPRRAHERQRQLRLCADPVAGKHLEPGAALPGGVWRDALFDSVFRGEPGV